LIDHSANFIREVIEIANKLDTAKIDALADEILKKMKSQWVNYRKLEKLFRVVLYCNYAKKIDVVL
jgi:hypothetical protein